MSLDLEARLRVFYASAPQSIRRIPTLEISHSQMTQVWNLWREPFPGVTNIGGVDRAMLPINFEDELAGSMGHLDQKFVFRLDLTDSQDLFLEELDRISRTSSERVKLVFREFLSDDLTAPQATAILQIETVAVRVGAATINAVAPRLNIRRTGEIYSTKEIPMLRGFL